VRYHVQGEPGVVIEPGQHLGPGPVRQRIVGEISLPALVRLPGFEPQIRRPEPLARLEGHQAGPGQIPAGRGPRDPDLMMIGQMPADRVRARVQTLPGQVFPQLNDQVRDPGARGQRTARRRRAPTAFQRSAPARSRACSVIE
jgi:hypothetical protein